MKPLEGITVLEFSTMITASFAAMMMAEQGAKVIKVEPMNVGDPMRYQSQIESGIRWTKPHRPENFAGSR